MLLITREADYALRIMRALAGGEQRTAADICQQEQIPDQFVYKIAKNWKRPVLSRLSVVQRAVAVWRWICVR